MENMEKESKPSHKKMIHGHAVYYGDGCEDGIYYLAYNLDMGAANDAFRAAKHDYTGFEFESQRKKEQYILTHNRGAGNYTLERK